MSDTSELPTTYPQQETDLIGAFAASLAEQLGSLAGQIESVYSELATSDADPELTMLEPPTQTAGCPNIDEVIAAMSQAATFLAQAHGLLAFARSSAVSISRSPR